MKIVAFYSLKGGVGKTAAAVNTAWLAGSEGVSTLLWDLDAQGAATWYLGVDPGLQKGARKVLRGKSPLGRERRSTAYEHLDVLPSDFEFREMDRLLDKNADSKRHLGDLLEPFSESDALVVLDCPPGLGTLSDQVV